MPRSTDAVTGLARTVQDGAAFDVVVIGGGVAGAACAFRLAGAGAHVLVLEREPRFADRVRGDVMYPWGVAEARRLGLGGVLDAVARPLRYWQTHVAGLPSPRPRDLAAEDAARRGAAGAREGAGAGETAVAFFHPELQAALLAAAERAGARVVRGAAATAVLGVGAPHGDDAGVPDSAAGEAEGVLGGRGKLRVMARAAGTEFEVGARLVIGADGRSSRARAWGGFRTLADEERLMFAGVMLEGAAVSSAREPRDTAHVFFAPSAGLLAMVLPVDERRTRVYGGYHLATGRRRLIGDGAFRELLGLVEAAGVPSRWLATAKQAGPLAQFSGADTWVSMPYAAGFALVGDAAAASDPSFGCGMALALRGARELTDALLAPGELGASPATGPAGEPAISFEPAAVDAAGSAYADATLHTTGALRRLTGWLRDVYREPGERADALRAELWPLFARDPARVPDVVVAGPDSPSDAAARARFFGDDASR